MTLNRDQIMNLVRLLGMTQDDEINCNECLDKVAEFAERQLAGQAIPEAFKAVQHHLAFCAECSEEYEALIIGLERMR
jgi:uncharacterized protein with PIN domain